MVNLDKVKKESLNKIQMWLNWVKLRSEGKLEITESDVVKLGKVKNKSFSILRKNFRKRLTLSFFSIYNNGKERKEIKIERK